MNKKKKKRIITGIIMMLMFCMMSMSAFAVTNVHILLPENQKWTARRTMTRTGNYSYASASVDSVYPSSGDDNFEKIQTRLVNSSDTLIMTSNYVTLNEGSGYKNLTIKEGYLADKTIYIQFRGNTAKAAEAIVNYKGN